MRFLSFVLVAEGVTDEALVSVGAWLLGQHLPADVELDGRLARWFSLPAKPHGLTEKVLAAIDLHRDARLLLVHLDADKESREVRVAQIEAAVGAIGAADRPPHICVVPVRETEAWLLADETAIRSAAGNPNGRVPLSLPRLAKLESVGNPKAVLNNALRVAHDAKTARKSKLFDLTGRPVRVAKCTTDFAPLRELPAFRRLEVDVAAFAAAWLAAHPPDAG